MQVVRFVDQYRLAAHLYGTSASELRARDAGRDRPTQRWLALDGGAPAGAVTAARRPDGRTFLVFAGSDPATIGPLAAAAGAALARSMHTTVDGSASARLTELRAAGFRTELESEAFEVPFGSALAGLRRAWVPTGLTIRSAAGADPARLFTLDNTLRHITPGTDGWRGDRKWFLDELAEAPPFDPDAYLVAIDEANGEYAAMVRVWRNPTGPRLGFVGVLPQYRNTVIAAALLRQALGAAAGWGHATFATEASTTNRAVHPRLVRLGGVSRGRFLQMVCG